MTRQSSEARIVYAERREAERVRSHARQTARAEKYWLTGRVA